jgi:hypothetical protein
VKVKVKVRVKEERRKGKVGIERIISFGGLTVFVIKCVLCF